MPFIIGGDHSIGFPTVRGIASVTSKRIGIVHVDRHADMQEKVRGSARACELALHGAPRLTHRGRAAQDLDERMHTCPWYYATELPNVPASNLVQIGIGGWQVRPPPPVPPASAGGVSLA
jgi:agmatinase